MSALLSVKPTYGVEALSVACSLALEELQFEGMRSAYDEITAAGQKQGYTTERMLLSLLEAEAVERAGRKLRYRLGQAKFPVQKELEQFDFQVSKISPAAASLISQLCVGKFSGKPYEHNLRGRFRKRQDTFGCSDRDEPLAEEKESAFLWSSGSGEPTGTGKAFQ
jgi:hypothetical protein